MKKLCVVLLLAACAWAQDAGNPAPQEPGSLRNPGQEIGTNLVIKEQAPSYSDIYCAGFVTKETLPMSNYVVGGYETPHATKFGARDTIYLTGPGYAVGQKYFVMRKISDPNKYETFPGEHNLLKRSGSQYSDIGQVSIIRIEDNVAVGYVDYSCEPLTPGDFLRPFQERPMTKYRPQAKPFDRFAKFTSGISGRIVQTKDFDRIVGSGQMIYINIGANKGLKEGDYVRITRNYDPKEMNPIDQVSLEPPYQDDTQVGAPHIPKNEVKKFPYRGLGEAIILWSGPETATAMITVALEDVQIGDVVEIPTTK